MANWQGFSLTDKGLALQAKINAGKATLKFTKISIGSGVTGNGVPNDLVQKEKDLTIGSITPEGQLVKIVTTLTNEGVQKAFKEREMGLYAQDPDEGEIMYAYMIDQDPDTLPAEGSTTIVSKRLTLALTFSNTGDVTAVLDSKQLLTFGDLETKAGDGTGKSIADNKAATPAWVQNLLSTFTNFKTSQITDFADGLIKKLALTTTIGAINALQTNSWFGQLLKMVLNASGVKYNIARNGYVCLGDFFGGLIIQWGTYNVICDYLQGPPDGRYEGNVVHALPLSFSNACYAALANVAADVGGPGDEAASVRQTTTSFFQLWGEVPLANATITASCVFIGQ